jgi:hypothetical protein
VRSNKTPYSKSAAHVFLFNADTPELGVVYGDPCDQVLMHSLLTSDTQHEINTRVLRGDVLLAQICDEITHVSYTIKPHRMSMTLQTNRALYTSLVWDLSEAISGQWNTLDVEDFPLVVGSHNVYCISCTNLPISVRATLDSCLRGTPGYIGSVQIDLGNPLQTQLFLRCLIGGLLICGRKLYLRSASPEEDTIIPPWASLLPFEAVQTLAEQEFDNRAPPLLLNRRLSPRGKITLQVMKRKGEPSHRQRVARALYLAGSSVSTANEPVDFSAQRRAPFEDAIVPREKLVSYALNPDHPDGKEKAMLFRDLLGIRANDWKYLAAQLIMGLSRSEVRSVRSEKFGVKYHADVPVVGLNGQSRMVRTAWIIAENQPARLITAYIAREDKQTGEKAEPPPVLQNDIQGNARWAALIDLARSAGQQVAQQTIPTPMVVQDGNSREVIKEGSCGGAYVVIPDARSGFARWLRVSRIGASHSPSGQRVYAETGGQSQERAEAYAHAFANVLKMNGVECSVEVYDS